MKLGLGLYRDSLSQSNFQFARQCGATHLVVHLVDYFKGARPVLSRGTDDHGWGITQKQPNVWSEDNLRRIKSAIESNGLVWEAIENFDPSDWFDILLDGPARETQMEGLKTIVRTVGKVGIPIIGYNFSIAGVWGWSKEAIGRGAAISLVFDESKIDAQLPIPNGMVWNMTYDLNAPKGTVPPISQQEIWYRYEMFLKDIIPVAEEAGVKLALHPDDPPVESLRLTARLVNQPSKYQKVIDIINSPNNCLEFCMGSIQEMIEGDIYDSLEKYSSQNRIGYIHFRNVKGKVPNYREVFVDEGDIEMLRALRVLKDNKFEGVLIPDHTPEMSCDAPWHAGMAFALGYMKAALQFLEK